MANVLISGTGSANTTPASTSFVELETSGGVSEHATNANIITKSHGLSDGIVKVASGVMTIATGGTDFANASHSHVASDITSGTIATALLGSGTASSSTYLRGDQTWATIAASGDASTNTSTSVVNEAPLFADTSGKLLKRSSFTGIIKQTSGVSSVATAGTDYYNPGGTDVAVTDGGTGSSTASGARTNLGLVIGTDVLAPTGSAASLTSFPTFNQNTTGSAAKLTTARNINGVAFDGTANITIPTTLLTPTAVKTANYTAAAGDLVLTDTTSGVVNITLPTTPADKSIVGTKNITFVSNVTITCGGSATFSKAGGSTVFTMPTSSQGATFQYQASSDIWFLIDDVYSLTQLNSYATTLTNKRVTRRVLTTNAPGATPSTNTDNVDIQTFTGLNAAITSMTTNLSGTPVDGDKLEFRFVDDGTARAITWGTSFASSGTVTLPTTTVISTPLRVGFEYSTIASINKWICIAKA